MTTNGHTHDHAEPQVDWLYPSEDQEPYERDLSAAVLDGAGVIVQHLPDDKGEVQHVSSWPEITAASTKATVRVLNEPGFLDPEALTEILHHYGNALEDMGKVLARLIGVIGTTRRLDSESKLILTIEEESFEDFVEDGEDAGAVAVDLLSHAQGEINVLSSMVTATAGLLHDASERLTVLDTIYAPQEGPR